MQSPQLQQGIPSSLTWNRRQIVAGAFGSNFGLVVALAKISPATNPPTVHAVDWLFPHHSFCALLLALAEEFSVSKHSVSFMFRHMTFQFHHGFAALLPQILSPLQAPTRDIHDCSAP